MEVITAAVAVGVGVLIGASGVGGVLLISFLVLFGGLGIHQAAATSLFSFLFTGLLGTWLFQRKGSIDWRLTLPVCAGAAVFSYLGVLASAATNPRILSLIVGCLVVVTGINILVPRQPKRARVHTLNARAVLSLLAVGATSGFGSGVSGAGGPVFAVPIMVAMRYSALAAIGTSQVLQVIAAASGSIGNLQRGLVSWELAAWVTVFQLAGLAWGVRLAHSVDERWLKLLAGILCAVAGAMLIGRAW